MSKQFTNVVFIYNSILYIWRVISYILLTNLLVGDKELTVSNGNLQ